MVHQKREKMQTEVIWDMHAHLACLTNEKYKNVSDEVRKLLAYEELNGRRSQNIAAFFSCGTPEEWEFMQALCKNDLESDMHTICRNASEEAGFSTRLSFGIHPWYSDRYNPEAYKTYFELCDAVGEIGMDSVWCEVPLMQQRKMFELQLQLAADLGKPIVLHTKGQEQEIAEIIRDFPGKICVHWYSGEIRHLEQYLQKECYFTLGPDFMWRKQEELYQYMIQNIPEDRLFLETDGLDAVIWAYEEAGRMYDDLDHTYMLLGDIMYGNLQELSACKKKKPKEMRMKLQQNLFDFLT